MSGWLIFYIVVLWIANVILCGWLAEQKNRKEWNWVGLALAFGPLATLALAGSPEKKEF